MTSGDTRIKCWIKFKDYLAHVNVPNPVSPFKNRTIRVSLIDRFVVNVYRSKSIAFDRAVSLSPLSTSTLKKVTFFHDLSQRPCHRWSHLRCNKAQIEIRKSYVRRRRRKDTFASFCWPLLLFHQIVADRRVAHFTSKSANIVPSFANHKSKVTHLEKELTSNGISESSSIPSLPAVRLITGH